MDIKFLLEESRTPAGAAGRMSGRLSAEQAPQAVILAAGHKTGLKRGGDREYPAEYALSGSRLCDIGPAQRRDGRRYGRRVCPDAFRPALAPAGVACRAGARVHGDRERFGRGDPPSDSLAGSRRRLATDLAGRVAPVGQTPSDLAIATHYVPSQVIHHFGGEKIIAGDNWYADLDDDRLPDVGDCRLPADSLASWNRWSPRSWPMKPAPPPAPGAGGSAWWRDWGDSGALADAARGQCQAAADRGDSGGLCHDRNVWQLRSPYCPDPRQFHDTALGPL